jgi:prevent-host-death family protein
MATITLHAAKTNLSKLVKRAEAGEEIIIARGNVPVVRLVPVNAAQAELPATGRFGLGVLKGKLDVPDSFFFDPLPDDELALWDGEGDEP